MNWLKMLSCWKDTICKDRQPLYYNVNLHHWEKNKAFRHTDTCSGLKYQKHFAKLNTSREQASEFNLTVEQWHLGEKFADSKGAMVGHDHGERWWLSTVGQKLKKVTLIWWIHLAHHVYYYFTTEGIGFFCDISIITKKKMPSI